MPPKKTDTQTSSADMATLIVACLAEKNITLGKADYQRMAALDGVRTESSFDHALRPIKARAKELLEKDKQNGGGSVSVDNSTPGKKKTAATKATNGEGSGRKRGQYSVDQDIGVLY